MRKHGANRMGHISDMMYSFILLIFFLVPQSSSKVQDEMYHVDNFGFNSAIYFEKMSDVKIYNDEWCLITFIDLNRLAEQYKVIRYYVHKLQTNCDRVLSFGPFVCENKHFLQSVDRRIRELEEKHNIFNDVIGSGKTERGKRGVFNFVGSISKILFGTLDDSDAQYYNQQIDKVYDNNKKLASLVQDQTNIVESFLHTINTTFSEMHTEFLRIEERIGKLEKVSDEIIRQERMDKLQIDMNAHVIELDSLTNSYENHLEILINAVMLGFKGLIHPELVSPTQLIKILSEVKPAIKSTLDFPSKLNPKNAADIISVSTVHIFCINNRLIYTLHIPLLEVDLFELYHLIPIPKHIEVDVYTYIHPSKKFIIASQSRQKLLLLDELSDEKCKPLKGLQICLQQQPFYSAYTHKSCETDLLTTGKTDVQKNCDVRLLRTRTSSWTKLSRRNSWLFFTTKIETLDIICNEQNSNHIQINGSGIISLEPHCKAWSNTVELTSQNVESSNHTINSTVVSPAVIWDELWTELLSNNTEHIPQLIPREYNKPNIHLGDLQSVSVKLSEVRQRAKNIMDETRQTYWINTHNNYIWYIFYFLGILVTLWLLCNGGSCWLYKSLFKWTCMKDLNCAEVCPCFGKRSEQRSVVEVKNPRDDTRSTATFERIRQHRKPATSNDEWKQDNEAIEMDQNNKAFSEYLMSNKNRDRK